MYGQTGGYVRGRLLEWDTAPSGELSVRTQSNQVLRFLFDGKTYVEREKRVATMLRLQKGDDLEIVSDAVGTGSLRYARTIHVIEEQPKPSRVSAASLARLRAWRSPSIDDLIPRGNLTFAGVISRLNDERLVLRTRSQGDKVILLRQDTRYLDGGSQVGPGTLKPNTRVFVRAGTNLDNEIEAYSVMWGEILTPDGR